MSRVYVDNKSLSRQWELFELFGAVFPQSRMDQRDFPQLEQKRFAGRLRHAGFESKKVGGGRKRWVLSKDRADALKHDFMCVGPMDGDRVGMGLRLGVPKVTALRSLAA